MEQILPIARFSEYYNKLIFSCPIESMQLGKISTLINCRIVTHQFLKATIVFLFLISFCSFFLTNRTASAQNIESRKIEDPTIVIENSMATPEWALAQRELIELNGKAVELYANKFLDKYGYFPITPNWGYADGPDDLMENIHNWPLAHALGGPNSIIKHWKNAWEGHIDQFSQAKIPELGKLAKDGIYYKEFITSFDWEHNSEALGPFYFYGLSQPLDRLYEERLRRFAGFYMNEDPNAPNYDPEHKVIRSLFNGSRGPKLTPTSPSDWAGPPGPNTDSTSSDRTRFHEANNIRGDHPLNLNTTMLPLHAYMLTQESKYRKWVLEYVNAWRKRIDINNGNIPSNVGLDGTIGGEWDGKWYGGVFGWNSPDEGERNYVFRGPPEAFGGALLLTGNQDYTAVLRRQFDNLFEVKKIEDDQILLPRYYGDEGWYGYDKIGEGPSGALGNHVNVLLDIYMWSLRPEDRERLPSPENAQMRHHPDLRWIEYLEGEAPDYPITALKEAIDDVQSTTQQLQNSDIENGNLTANPVSTEALINLTLGANNPGGSTHGPLPLHAQVRHFDPVQQRAGLPTDVAALVNNIKKNSISLTLLNLDPSQEQTITVQMGAYGEHQATQIATDKQTTSVNAPYFNVRLAPGAGNTLTIDVKRYVNQPTLAFPWDRWWMVKNDKQ